MCKTRGSFICMDSPMSRGRLRSYEEPLCRDGSGKLESKGRLAVCSICRREVNKQGLWVLIKLLLLLFLHRNDPRKAIQPPVNTTSGNSHKGAIK